MFFDFADDISMRSICGPNDVNISYIEELLECRIALRGNRIEAVFEDESKEELFENLFDKLQHLALICPEIGKSEILMEYKSLQNSSEVAETESFSTHITVGTKAVFPKGKRQLEYIRAMQTNQVVFATGPAGTGKTFLAVNYCLGELLSGRKQKIILTRPVIEAGESLGFLPGDLSQKLNPYLKPLYDSMEATLAPSTVKRLEDTGHIEIAPLAYMRGRSINNACIILDEAQNTTVSQMKMFLTRLGENSCAVITGDVTQIDLTKNQVSGLVDAMERLTDVEGIEFVTFSGHDTVRSRLVQRIIGAYGKN